MAEMRDTDTDTDTDTDGDDVDRDRSELESMIETCDASIAELRDKIENGRINSPEHDTVRIKYHRALAYVLRTKLKVVEARKADEFEQRLEELEKEVIPGSDHVPLTESDLRAEIESVRGSS